MEMNSLLWGWLKMDFINQVGYKWSKSDPDSIKILDPERRSRSERIHSRSTAYCIMWSYRVVSLSKAGPSLEAFQVNPSRFGHVHPQSSHTDPQLNNTYLLSIPEQYFPLPNCTSPQLGQAYSLSHLSLTWPHPCSIFASLPAIEKKHACFEKKTTPVWKKKLRMFIKKSTPVSHKKSVAEASCK